MNTHATPIIREPITTILARASRSHLQWLWCMHCERFFQVKDLLFDGTRFEQCPFDGCHAAGLDFDIFLWDDWREPDDPRWPSDPKELTHGDKSPDMQEFYEEKERQRRISLLRGFAESPEYARLAPARGWAHWTDEFLEKLQWWGMAPQYVDVPFLSDTLQDFAFWIACTPDDAADIIAELAAFYRYCGHECGYELAAECVEFLESADTAEQLRAAIITEGGHGAPRYRRPTRPRLGARRLSRLG